MEFLSIPQFCVFWIPFYFVSDRNTYLDYEEFTN